ncbi:hypothetical protein [Bradyrhizobium yuanmingense]|uniref:hypothetical protein n=1 Tax=Bradyrhizobium yuanmingense TaxID=108015 RepID=UPI003D2ED03E
MREAVLDLAAPDRPRFRCKNLEAGNLSQWDGEWFYHWTSGGWDWVGWAEPCTETEHQRELVRTILRRIRFAGRAIAFESFSLRPSFETPAGGGLLRA